MSVSVNLKQAKKPISRYYPEMVFDLGIPYIVVSAGESGGKDV